MTPGHQIVIYLLRSFRLGPTFQALKKLFTGRFYVGQELAAGIAMACGVRPSGRPSVCLSEDKASDHDNSFSF